jgi:methyl-accepting chemotaxis protein
MLTPLVNQSMQETNSMVTHANQTMNDLTRSMQEISQASEEARKTVKPTDSPKDTPAF